jgi:hypothetical protein
MPLSPEDLVSVAKACADRLDLPKHRKFPTLSDVEDQCEDEYGELIGVLQEEEVFAVDLNEQQRLSNAITEALPPDKQELLTELTDRHLRHVWLQQEAAYYVGLAVGLRMAEAGRSGTTH